MRAFIAVHPPQDLQERLAAMVCSRRPSPAGRVPLAEGVRWVAAESLHLTMKFLGEIPDDQVDELAGRLEEAVTVFSAFGADLVGGGVFPNPKRARILWLGIDAGADELVALAGVVDRAMSDAGFEPERRPFKPHLTVGRVRNPRRVRGLEEWLHALDQVPFGTFEVDRLVLFESVLTPQRAVYKERRVITFSR